MKSKCNKLGLLALVLAASQSQAALITSFGDDASRSTSTANSTAAASAFQTQLSNAGLQVGTETFDTALTPAGLTGLNPMALNFGGVRTATMTSAANAYVRDDCIWDSCALSGSQYFGYAGDSLNQITVRFNGLVSAMGFYAMDVGDFGATLELELVDSFDNITQLTMPQTHVGDGNLFFFGFYDSSALYKEVRFNRIGGFDDYFAFDDMVIGATGRQTNPVPEPASLALLGLGLVGAAAARRKQQR